MVFGGAGVGSTGVVELSALDGTNGFALNGIDAGNNTGESVSCAGDLNGDGYDDFLIQSRPASANGAASGESYVIFGGPGVGGTGALDLSALDGTIGFVLNGIDAGDYSGVSVSSAGDVNGDGVDDIIIGAYKGEPNGAGSGESYVVFGGAGIGATGAFELSALNGANGFVLNGINAGDYCGVSVSAAGDVNGDGYDDVIIGAYRADPNGSDSGESYLVFGGAGVGSTGVVELSALNGFNGFVLNGVGGGDNSGASVSSAGDVNGDGVDDVIIGASNADPNGSASGESYVVLGLIGSTWISPVDGDFDTPSNWLSGLTPAGGTVVIEPAFGVTVTGPAGALSIGTLALGAGFGQTDFAMQSGSLVEVEDALTISGSGAISGSGSLVSDAGLTNDGLIDPTDLTLISSGGVTNNGEMRFESFSRGSAASAMDVFGSLDNSATGEIFFRGSATLETTGGLTNDGAIDFADADVTLRGDVANTGAMSGSAASVIVLTDSLTNDGSFVLASDSSLSILGDLSGSGVTGPGGGAGGTVFIGGTFTPARAMEAGLAAFGGDVSLGATSATDIDLAGAGSFDEITSLGAVNIAGDLTVNLLGGYEPQAGDSFTIVSAASVNGAFANVTLPTPPKGSAWDLAYAANEVVLSLLGGNPADLSGDGCVDSADLAILLAAWNSVSADLNGDNVTDSADLAILLAAWGGGCGE